MMSQTITDEECVPSKTDVIRKSKQLGTKLPRFLNPSVFPEK